MFIPENLGKSKVEKEKRNTTASINHCEHFDIFFQVFFFNGCTCILKNMVLAFCSLLFSTLEYIRNIVSYLSVQFSRSVMSDSLWPYELQHARPPCPSPSPSSLKLMSIESVMPSSHLILCRPLLLLPPIPPSIRVFSNESILRMRWPKYWSFSFSIIPSREHPGLISSRMDWLDLLAVQGTLKSLLQHHSSQASTLQCSAFFTV